MSKRTRIFVAILLAYAIGLGVLMYRLLGDIDPRAEPEYCGRISDKARAIAGSVLEAIMRRCNTA